ncbi:MAG TPA: hypothetical protein VK386_04490 [Acidimicrobiales bacterium]|nr:hypothetical protein [Acidimicrobiales bacterium]
MSVDDFNYVFSLVFVVVVAAVGVYSVAGAIEAGVLYAVLTQLVSSLSSRYSSLLALVFGLAALTYVRHPEGVVAYGKAWVLDRAEQLVRHLRRAEVQLAASPGPGGPTNSGAEPDGSRTGGRRLGGVLPSRRRTGTGSAAARGHRRDDGGEGS